MTLSTPPEDQRLDKGSPMPNSGINLKPRENSGLDLELEPLELAGHHDMLLDTLGACCNERDEEIDENLN